VGSKSVAQKFESIKISFAQKEQNKQQREGDAQERLERGLRWGSETHEKRSLWTGEKRKAWQEVHISKKLGSETAKKPRQLKLACGKVMGSHMNL